MLNIFRALISRVANILADDVEAIQSKLLFELDMSLTEILETRCSECQKELNGKWYETLQPS